jgi:hypothetical protein
MNKKKIELRRGKGKVVKVIVGFMCSFLVLSLRKLIHADFDSLLGVNEFLNSRRRKEPKPKKRKRKKDGTRTVQLL